MAGGRKDFFPENNTVPREPLKLERSSVIKKSRNLSSSAFLKSPFTKSPEATISTHKSNTASELIYENGVA